MTSDAFPQQRKRSARISFLVLLNTYEHSIGRLTQTVLRNAKELVTSTP